ncbi:MAG: shikimate dehydrogenase [Alphaproteobacteria bacterium CG_4_10_14_0_2_um_filter_63_37]|nr:MAG: shikimate dehydrogenase [Proteobacteria bacterium CG1_02_64_396]PJA24653.1 MAG: shikimate dehydrogenase [Alphaproteobacteria bacterium CG_4_10_14_0_2_um_filter_63_37]
MSHPTPINGATQVFGIIGDPVAHSLSPRFQNRFLHQAGIDGRYLPFPLHPDHLASGIKGLWAAGVQGLNATIPHKEALVSLLDDLTPEAQRLGAVNTLIRTEKGWRGDNTDGLGLRWSLRHEGPDRLPEQALLFGAGGASRGVLSALAQEGVRRVEIINRDPKRGSHLAAWAKAALGLDVTVGMWESAHLRRRLPETTLMLNATALGLHGEVLPEIDWTLLPSQAWVVDIVYHRQGTPLVRDARMRGLRAIDGLGMLVGQGAASFERWTGVTPNPTPTLDWLRAELASTPKEATPS